jgi:dihydrofolate reductase
MEKIIIAAVAENGAIGKDGDIPWHIPEDLEHFKQKTTGHPVIMGRKTYESLPENFRPLPDRTNIVLTRSDMDKEGIRVAGSMEKAYSIAEELDDRAFIIGGASVYKQALPDANKMEITEVKKEVDGDTFFPEFDREEWNEERREEHEDFDFVTYTR